MTKYVLNPIIKKNEHLILKTMNINFISNLQDFNYLKEGNLISVVKWGNSGFDIGHVLLEPSLSGNIPKVLIETKAGEKFFIYFFNNELVNDEFKPICDFNKHTQITVK